MQKSKRQSYLHNTKYNCNCKVLFLPIAYVGRRESYVLTRVCLSVHGGDSPDRSTRGRYPSQVQMGVPWPGPNGGYPSQVQMWGTLARSGWGYPMWGTSHLGWGTTARSGWGYPPAWDGVPLAGMGYPPTPGTGQQIVHDTLRSICLLRSRRRTFSFS